jgi:structural maintenance of chromosome 4
LKRAKDLEHITQLRDIEKQRYDGLRKRRLDEFMAGFNLISMKLKEPFSEGIIFSVMPPKKSWKNISNLSGGEKVRSAFTYSVDK